jgi:hypothetical protein
MSGSLCIPGRLGPSRRATAAIVVAVHPLARPDPMHQGLAQPPLAGSNITGQAWS